MKFLADISKKDWTLINDDVQHFFHIILEIGFRDGKNTIVEFNDMAYGYSIVDDQGNNIFEQKYPEANMVFVSTDEDVLESRSIDYLFPDKNYTIDLWAENDGDFWQTSHTFSIPRLPQPFPSWTYNEEEYSWIPPIPHPLDENNSYSWDEENQQWIISEELV